MVHIPNPGEFMLRVILLSCLALTQMSVAAWAKSNKNEVPVVKPIENYRFETQLGRVDQRVIKLVGEDKQKSLRHMAEATVLSDFCPMVKVDKDKFTKDFDGLASSGITRKPAEQRDIENKLMTFFGVYVGLLIAEGVESDVQFCEVASQIQKNQGPVSHYWLADVPTAAAPAAVPTAPVAKK
jgi:hypothetical protein